MEGDIPMRVQPYSTISSFSGVDGDVQVAVGPRTGTIIIDAQGAARGVDGIVRHNHGTVRLTYDVACELRDFIDQIAEPPEYRQATLPAIWSEVTFTRPLAKPTQFRRQRAA
jgi:hypothetical protein